MYFLISNYYRRSVQAVCSTYSRLRNFITVIWTLWKATANTEVNKERKIVAATDHPLGKVVPSTGRALIRCQRNDAEYTLCLPFNRGAASSNSNLRVFLRLRESNLEITQAPGLPYLCSPNSLKGIAIFVTKEDGETILCEYQNDQVPGYLAEIDLPFDN